MELSSNGVWVPVEDGVEVLNCGPSARRPGYEDMDEGLQIIEGKSRRARSSHESDSDTLSSSGKRLRPSQFAGLLSNCGHQNLGSSFVTSCMHVTCKICLKSHVESVIEKSMITVEPSYDEIRIQLLCPDQRCGMELSKTDLIHLLDIITVETYENWLRTAYRDLYGAMSSANMINCIKCQQGKAIKCSRMSSIKGKGKAKKNNDTSYLQSAASNGIIQCPDSWVCTNCEFSWCAACGFAFDSQHKGSGSKGNHVCSEATNYRINDIVTDLELIYNEYITGATRSDDQPGKKPCNKYNTRSRKSGNQPGTSTTNVNYHPSGINMGLLTPYGSNAVKTVWGAGTGFGGHRHEGKSTVEKVKKVEKELDCRTESVLKSLANVLKNIAASRHKPVLGFSAYVLFKRENVVGQLLEYLVMNDSMMDICARSALYLQLSDLLKTMTQYPELLIVLVGSCFQIDRKGGSDVHGNVRSDASVIKKMKNIYDQSKIIVNRFKDGNDDKNVEADLDIARCLLECYEKLEKSSEKQAISTPYVISISEEEDSRMTGDGEATSDQTTSASKEEVSKTIEDNEVSSDHCKNVSLYKESLKPLQFGDYPLIGKVFHHHSYSSHFDESGANPQSIDNTGVHNKNRTLHIAKEVASLATNLPLEWESSIHVRVDPVRMDLLKALIVGPKGTPYQNGIFIFDIYLPPDYPQVPPKVNFLTTGCGKVRFNPNLYADGKVCLSLLGTWDGPSWQPWKSTLLQVLVSIQSLIFVAEPFYNEPGHETWAHCRDAAEGENRNHRYNTLKIAILGALRDPDSSFKEVILTHFQHKKDEIVSQCKEWITASGDPTHKMYSKVVNTANEVVLEVAKVSPL